MSIFGLSQEVEEIVIVGHEREKEKEKMMGWTLTVGALQKCTFQGIRIKCHHPTINIVSLDS